MEFVQDPMFIPVTLFLIFQVWFFWNTGRNEKFYELAKTTTDPEVMKKLLKDGSWFVRCGLILNPQVPEDILESLSKDKDSQVRNLATEWLERNRSRAERNRSRAEQDRHWTELLKSLESFGKRV